MILSYHIIYHILYMNDLYKKKKTYIFSKNNIHLFSKTNIHIFQKKNIYILQKKHIYSPKKTYTFSKKNISHFSPWPKHRVKPILHQLLLFHKHLTLIFNLKWHLVNFLDCRTISAQKMNTNFSCKMT